MKNSLKKLSLFFILLFSLSACAKSCGKNSNQKLSALDIFPEQHQLVLSFNWKKFAATDYSQSLFQKISPDLKQFSSQLETLYVSTSIRKPGEEPSSLALIEGQFDEAKILEWLTQLSKTESKELQTLIWKGKTIYISPKDPEMGMSILNKNQIIWGVLSALKQSLDVLESNKGSLAKQNEFSTLWAKRDANKLVWGAALLTQQDTSQALPLLQGLKHLLLNADLQNNALAIEVAALSNSEEDAKNLSEFISSYKNIISTQADPFMKQLLSQLKLEQKQQEILASLNLTADQLQVFSSQVQFVAPESQVAVPVK